MISTLLPFVFLLLLLFNGIFAAPSSPVMDDNEQEKIIGGQMAHPQAYAWEVSVGNLEGVPSDPRQRYAQPPGIKLGAHICGGILLNNRVVLTAAHCVVNYLTKDDPIQPASRIGVGVYSSGGSSGRDLVDIYNQGRIPVMDIRIKKGYESDSPSFKDDIALLLLSQTVDLTRHPNACIARQDVPPGSVYQGNLKSIGWGTITPVIGDQLTGQMTGYQPSQQLKQSDVQDISPGASWCQNRPDLTCLKGINEPGPCKGDSGGSLVLNDRWVLGLTSFGPSASRNYKTHYCNGLVAYTRLSKHIAWIESMIGRNSFCSG